MTMGLLLSAKKFRLHELVRIELGKDTLEEDLDLTTKLTTTWLFWAKYSAEGKDCKIKTALSNVAKRYLTPSYID